MVKMSHAMREFFSRTKKFVADWHRPAEFFIVVAGFLVGAVTFYLEQEERRNQRLVAGWQLLSEKAPGASGKKRALLYLLENQESLVAINLSYKRHGAPVYLQHLEVYNEETDQGADFRLSSFAGAIMANSDLRNSDFSMSCLQFTELGKSKLMGSKFVDADLTNANLNGADMTGANISGANLTRALMQTTKGLTQEQIDTARFCPSYLPPRLPDGLTAPRTQDCEPVQSCSWSLNDDNCCQ